MKFTDYILIDAINPELKATDIQGVIREIVQPLLDAGGIEKEAHEKIIKYFLKREELGSTGQGGGIAVPHTERGAKRTIGTVAISTDGIDFDSPDGEKVYIFFPILGSDISGDFLRVIEHLTRRLKDGTLQESLKQAKTREEILALLEEVDNRRR